MSLFQLREKTTFNKTEFFSFTPGTHIVRMLTAPVAVFEHYIPRARTTIKCLGTDECPICQNNRKIFLENPDDYRNIPGYIGRSYRHKFNVLDRTPVKICPSCGHENKKGLTGQFAPACEECGTMIVSEESHPLEKVRLMGISDTNAQQLEAYNMSVQDEKGNPIGLMNYDIQFNVVNVKGRKTISPSPLPENNDKVEVPNDALFDAEKGSIVLNPEEIINLLKGVALRDIFLARKVTPDEESTLENENKEVAGDIASKIADLYAENTNE